MYSILSSSLLEVMGVIVVSFPFNGINVNLIKNTKQEKVGGRTNPNSHLE
jgi:hypothetical protein